MIRNKGGFVIVGIVGNAYNWLSQGIVGTLLAGRGKAAL